MKNIFIGNLNLATTPDQIRALFAPFGNVRNLKLMTAKDTGASRGFAFLEMVDADAQAAIAALDGQVFDGQIIEVREGRPKLHTLHNRRAAETTAAPDSI